MTMYLPAQVKTLAPKPFKRELRRTPLSCKNFQRQTSVELCHCKINTSPDFIVRGKEINDVNGKSKNDDTESNVNVENANEKKLFENFDECMPCCACLIELENKTNTPQLCTDKTELCVDVDNYHMDPNGDLPKRASIPTTRYVEIERNDHWPPCTMISTKRACSPNTAQVIRITLNNKNEEDAKEHAFRCDG